MCSYYSTIILEEQSSSIFKNCPREKEHIIAKKLVRRQKMRLKKITKITNKNDKSNKHLFILNPKVLH